MVRKKRVLHESPIAGRFVCDSTWEKRFAVWADEHGLDYRRNKRGFRYYNILKKRRKYRRYYPDFKLSEGLYVEVKGYESIVDRFKWSAFPHELIILRRDQIESLDDMDVEDLLRFVLKKGKRS